MWCKACRPQDLLDEDALLRILGDPGPKSQVQGSRMSFPEVFRISNNGLGLTLFLGMFVSRAESGFIDHRLNSGDVAVDGYSRILEARVIDFMGVSVFFVSFVHVVFVVCCRLGGR
jgi:hypothetical protein